jgi:hypothetical protein
MTKSRLNAGPDLDVPHRPLRNLECARQRNQHHALASRLANDLWRRRTLNYGLLEYKQPPSNAGLYLFQLGSNVPRCLP